MNPEQVEILAIAFGKNASSLAKLTGHQQLLVMQATIEEAMALRKSATREQTACFVGQVSALLKAVTGEPSQSGEEGE
jgi:hypothetical protein